MDSPHHTVVSLPPIIYSVPAIYRRKFGPFAVRDVPGEPQAEAAEIQRPSAFAIILYRGACYFAAIGAIYSIGKVYL